MCRSGEGMALHYNNCVVVWTRYCHGWERNSKETRFVCMLFVIILLCIVVVLLLVGALQMCVDSCLIHNMLEFQMLFENGC